MAFMDWTDDLALGIEAIDKQHRKLVEMINQFYAAFEQDNTAAFLQLLDDLTRYAAAHFDFEEQYFERFGYEGAEEHRQEHEAFRKKVSDMHERSDDGRIVLSMEATRFVRGWLRNHIQVTDRHYVECFKANGL